MFRWRDWLRQAARRAALLTERRKHGHEAGSSIPLIVLCFLIAALLVAGVTAASSAFLAQRDLQADCDGAAIAAASGLDSEALYAHSFPVDSMLPVANQAAAAVLERYREGEPPSEREERMTVHVDNESVTVACSRRVKIPFGAVFGFGGGIQRSAMGTTRSPLRQ